MKAIVVHQFGGPEVMKLEEAPKNPPGAGQVLVRIKAAGVNPVDTYIRAGVYARKPALPYTPGTDSAGIVDAVGEGVKRVKAGDRVYTSGTLTGTYAEFALAAESQVHPLPQKISYAQGAGVYVPFATACRALFQFAHARPGEAVLIHGATGGVGVAAVQLARAAGLTVIGTGGTEKGRALIKSEGAHHALDHRAPNYLEQVMQLTNGQGVNVILEMLANVNLGADLKVLAMRGRVVVIGSRGDVQITPRELMARDAAVFGMSLWNAPESDAQSIHAALIAGMENGTLRPVVGKEIPLAEASRAHKEVMEPGAYGKIVLVP
ncbi:MAG TPA: NADPH:quinone reductase [Candidatus Acidoferrales bacterium]|nr:NADPH:quinone reductase [Candidatus Acidoferrales bacterium]